MVKLKATDLIAEAKEAEPVDREEKAKARQSRAGRARPDIEEGRVSPEAVKMVQRLRKKKTLSFNSIPEFAFDAWHEIAEEEGVSSVELFYEFLRSRGKDIPKGDQLKLRYWLKRI